MSRRNFAWRVITILSRIVISRDQPWCISVSPAMPVVLDLPNSLRFRSIDPLQLWFIVPEDTNRLWCRLALERKGAYKATLLGPEGETLAETERSLRQSPLQQPEWQDLTADVPREMVGKQCSLRVQGTIDLLIQPRELARFAAASEGAAFSPTVTGPWE